MSLFRDVCSLVQYCFSKEHEICVYIDCISKVICAYLVHTCNEKIGIKIISFGFESTKSCIYYW